MSAKIILFFAILGIFAVLGESQSYDVLCSDIRGDECITNEDCKCSGDRYICNSFAKCDRPTLLDILERQPCRGIFKKYCVDNSDCYCKGNLLDCEANECVKSKTVAAF